MRKPIIGIVVDYRDSGEYSAFPWYAMRTNYASAIEYNGGVPILLPYSSPTIMDYIEIIHGLLIIGGDFDIHPKYYNQEISEQIGNIIKERTEFELSILESAFEGGVPVLGICGGMQLINVRLGGTLIQHISEGAVIHQQGQPKHEPSHWIDGTQELYAITGEYRFKVNSTHHQAVDKLGRDLIPCARAEDNIIEAIKLLNYDFCWGVQWHPEYLMTTGDRQIFKEFISASQAYAYRK